MKRIIVIICYIGDLPWYFDYFIHTCKFNPSVDFLIFADDRSWSKPLPLNVNMVYATLSDINKMASNKLGFKTSIYDGYKLNDFKPAYGYIFEDYVKGYDFWGHGDIDIIFGNIRKFITKNILEFYDIISVRHDYITGCFLLFKNSNFTNTLFMKSKDYKKVFESKKHYCFDETNFQYNEFVDNVEYPNRLQEVESMMHVVDRLNKEGKISAYFDFHIIEGLPGNLTWDKGRLFYRSTYEVLMYHMISFKKVFKPSSIPEAIPDYLTITSKSIDHGRKG